MRLAAEATDSRTDVTDSRAHKKKSMSTVGTRTEQSATLPSRAFEELETVQRIFHSLNSGYDSVTGEQLLAALFRAGILRDDPRLAGTLRKLRELGLSTPLSLEQFDNLIVSNLTLIENALTGSMILPDFESFSNDIHGLHQYIQGLSGGAVADYIPQLKRVDPNRLGVSICSVDGQRISIGDSQDPFVVQSTCKPINYCLALEEHGQEAVHHHVGREPSGRGFNELTLNKDGLPHNPMINAGAIMCCSMIKPNLGMADRFDHVLSGWADLAGGSRPGFNNSVYLSERQTADRNFALGYFIKERQVFPENSNLIDTLEFYFQCCSIEMNCDSMAVIASTLANAGICPLTGKQVLSPATVKCCLSLMYTCGMYDFSGEFAFTVGLPAKSGVSGAVMLVVPNVMGVTVWSPPLDSLGNSVRGLAFAKELVAKYNFHPYDHVDHNHEKTDPCKPKNREKLNETIALIWAASQGDVNEVKRLITSGVNPAQPDYDGRTPLHLAASEGRTAVIEYLISLGVPVSPVDRWGNTPLSDARRQGHIDTAALLEGTPAQVCQDP